MPQKPTTFLLIRCRLFYCSIRKKFAWKTDTLFSGRIWLSNNKFKFITTAAVRPYCQHAKKVKNAQLMTTLKTLHPQDKLNGSSCSEIFAMKFLTAWQMQLMLFLLLLVLLCRIPLTLTIITKLCIPVSELGSSENVFFSARTMDPLDRPYDASDASLCNIRPQ